MGGNDDFIVYEIGGKRGILSAKGEVVTEALYDSSMVRDDFAKRGWWMIAERGNDKWALNLKTGEQKKIDFDSIDYFANQHLVVSTEQGKALADAQAQLISAATYNWMGEPGDGLVAFREKIRQPLRLHGFPGQDRDPGPVRHLPGIRQAGRAGHRQETPTAAPARPG
ncbi:hypothetical protein [Pseudomonas protegens]|uniref:hypothetical protein n=1 Tax=Pseudomonas protegens TaxID=380021 RepID=UPI00215EF7DE|nr:hypothetical protein [Pseudomonas protegens]UVL70759.1 hypothetical protein LOY23_22320 [Pseudomonas protegens]